MEPSIPSHWPLTSGQSAEGRRGGGGGGKPLPSSSATALSDDGQLPLPPSLPMSLCTLPLSSSDCPFPLSPSLSTLPPSAPV